MDPQEGSNIESYTNYKYKTIMDTRFRYRFGLNIAVTV